MMKLDRISKNPNFQLLIAFFLIACNSPDFARESDTTASDSLTVLRKQFMHRPMIEKIVSVPGRILYYPFGIVLYGVEQSLVVVENKNYDQWLFHYITPKESKKSCVPAFSKREGVGLDYSYKGLLSARTKLSFGFKIGLNWRQKWNVKMEKIPIGRSRFFNDWSFLYQYITFDSFYGLGARSLKSARVGFSQEKAVATASIGIDLNKRSTFKILMGADHNNILQGHDKDYPSITEEYTADTLPGLTTGLRFARIGFSFDYDSRNHRGLTTNGWMLRTRAQLYRQVQKDDFYFWRAELDLKRHIHLFYGRTVMLRIASEISREIRDRHIPFFYLSELGRSETIRGFNQGRFRDHDMMLLSAEYRYPFWRTVSSVIFVDAGTVMHDIVKEYASPYHFGYGIGFRIQSHDKLFFKADIAHSQDGFRFYVTVND